MMLNVRNKLLSWFLLLLFLNISCASETEQNENKDDLETSETKDGTIEIIKQIKKVNTDGSYTVGYEADDGSFKIESRDVLGNIKGTYGYVDESGNIKRVSYSSNNITNLKQNLGINKGNVVQRIPKLNDTFSSTTRRPVTYYTTLDPSIFETQSTIQRSEDYVSSTITPISVKTIDVDEPKPKTSKPETLRLYHSTTTPRELLQSKFLKSSQAQKNDQVVKPEVDNNISEAPLFRRLAINHPTSETTEIPVSEKAEQSEIKSNILRRQLNPDKFDPHQHVYMLQQSAGDDSSHIYSSSDAVGTPRPLFTTTNRPGSLSSTTSSYRRSTVRYPKFYQTKNRNEVQQQSTTEQQESSNIQTESTPTPLPIIPNNLANEPLIAIKTPYQKEPILIPLRHLQRKIVQENNLPQNYQYVREPQDRGNDYEEQSERSYVRPTLPPRPVHVDQNGYVRDVQQNNLERNAHFTPTIPPKYQIPVPAPTENRDIDEIRPPVSIRDFQIILQELEHRQKKLERLHELVEDKKEPQDYQRPYYNNQVYQRQQIPQQYVQQNLQDQRRRQLAFQQRDAYLQQNLYNEQYAESQTPNKRVARLLRDPNEENNEENLENYLPIHVREMLLLKMLQLAINPALPMENDAESSTTKFSYFQKDPARNVEIIGEEPEYRAQRIK